MTGKSTRLWLGSIQIKQGKDVSEYALNKVMIVLRFRSTKVLVARAEINVLH